MFNRYILLVTIWYESRCMVCINFQIEMQSSYFNLCLQKTVLEGGCKHCL